MRTSAVSSSNRKRGERLGQLGLADAGRAEEHERADRPVRILQAGAGAAHRGRHGLHRLAPGRRRACRAPPPSCSSFSRSPSSILSTGTPVQRETTPATWSGVTASSISAAAVGLGLDLGELLLELRDDAVGELAGALAQSPLALRLVELGAGLVELLLELRPRVPSLSFSAFQRAVIAADCSSRSASSFSSRCEPVLGGRVGLLLQRLALDLAAA